MYIWVQARRYHAAVWMDGLHSMIPKDAVFFQKVCVGAAALTSSDPQPGTQTTACVW